MSRDRSFCGLRQSLPEEADLSVTILQGTRKNRHNSRGHLRETSAAGAAAGLETSDKVRPERDAHRAASEDGVGSRDKVGGINEICLITSDRICTK